MYNLRQIALEMDSDQFANWRCYNELFRSFTDVFDAYLDSVDDVDISHTNGA
jgi:hypothetical protein